MITPSSLKKKRGSYQFEEMEKEPEGGLWISFIVCHTGSHCLRILA